MVKIAEEEVHCQEIRLENDMSPSNYSKLGCLQDVLLAALHRKSTFWHHKSRTTWLKEGDVNSKFFHATVKSRRLKMFIHHIKNDADVWVDDNNQIQSTTIQFFTRALSCEQDSFLTDDAFLRFIPKIISTEDNNMLQAFPAEDEVKSVIFSMDANCAPKSDDFLACSSLHLGKLLAKILC